MHLFKQVCQRILHLSECLVTFMTSHGNQIWSIRYFTRAHCMINKDSFYVVMTNHYEVNVFYFLCYSAELDSKHNVAGFRLLSLCNAHLYLHWKLNSNYCTLLRFQFGIRRNVY